MRLPVARNVTQRMKRVLIVAIAAILLVPPLYSADDTRAGSYSNPEFVNGLDGAGTLNSGTQNAALSTTISPGALFIGDYMYLTKMGSASSTCVLTNASCELQIYNVSDPTTPEFVYGIESSGARNSTAIGDNMFAAATYGNYLYVGKSANTTNCNHATNKGGCELQIYDISNPELPVYTAGIDASGTLNSGTSGVAITQVKVRGNYLYVGSSSLSGSCSAVAIQGCEVRIYDLTDPVAPSYVLGIDGTGQIDAGSGSRTVNAIEFSGNHMFVGFSGDGTVCGDTGSYVGCEIHAYDITDPTLPVFETGVDTSGATLSGAATATVRSMYIKDTYLYAISSLQSIDCSNSNKAGCDIQIYDISDPSTIEFVVGIDISGNVNSGNVGVYVYGIDGEGDYIYVSHSGSSAVACGNVSNKVGCEVQIYDISDPTNPVYASGVDASGAANSGSAVNTMGSVYAHPDGYFYAFASSGNTTDCGSTNKVGCEMQIYATVQLGPEPVITTPTAVATNNWSPSVDWDTATTCEYSWNEVDWQTVSCAAAGTDIPEPAEATDISLFVRATNASGATTESVTFTYDVTAPTVSAGDNTHTNSPLAHTTPTASDTNSGIATYAWTKQSGAGVLSFSDDTILRPTVSADTEGSYVARLTVTDAAGNSAYDDVTIVWDQTEPAIQLDAFPDLFSNDTTPSFTFSATDALSTPVTFECQLDSGGYEDCNSSYVSSALADGAHQLDIRATDQAENQDTLEYTWTVDTAPPVITRVSSATVTIMQGDSYSDEGATALDGVSGDITGDIVVTNPVNNDVPGTYTVRYNVRDEAGNSAVEVTRSVTVLSSADRNDDGTADSTQQHVAPLVDPVTDDYVIVEVADECELSNSSVITEANNEVQDPFYNYSTGLIDFTAECNVPGFTTQVTLYHYGVLKNDLVVRKYSPLTQSYGTITDVVMNEQTINGHIVTVVQYEVQDGGPLDADGVENGVIVDPIGLAAQVVQVPNTGLRAGRVGSF